MVVQTAKGNQCAASDRYTSNTPRSHESLALKIDTLMNELVRSARLERRLDRLERDQERDVRLEVVKKDVASLFEISGKILESTNTLAADLKSFSLDVGEHLKEVARFGS